MAIAMSPPSHSVFDIGKRLKSLLEEAEQESDSSEIPEWLRQRLHDVAEALRASLAQKYERDPRSLFDLDERLIDLMDRVEERVGAGGGIPEELALEINDYLEAFRTKVDRIAGYLRWQEFIAVICDEESERLETRKKTAERRVGRLKEMLLAFMMSRGLKKIDGEKASIGLQDNSAASLLIDDPSEIGECFFERRIRFTKTELREIIGQLAEGQARQRLEAALKGDGWEINVSALRFAVQNNSLVSGARLVKGHHVRVR